jgi:hypothetical protein
VLALLLMLLVMPAQAPAAPRPIERTLDVMGIPEPAQVTAGGACGCVSATSGAGPPHPQVKVTLVYVNPESFGIGDRIVFELLVEHVGNAPLPIALTRDPEVAPSCRGAAGDVRTRFALMLKGSHDIIAIGPGLYGSIDSAGTTMTLNPGERLRIRIPATATGIDPKRDRAEDPQSLNVDATFSVERGACQLLYEHSQNVAPVLVLRPRLP